MRIHCPTCGSTLEIVKVVPGTNTRCPKCGEAIELSVGVKEGIRTQNKLPVAKAIPAEQKSGKSQKNPDSAATPRKETAPKQSSQSAQKPEDSWIDDEQEKTPAKRSPWLMVGVVVGSLLLFAGLGGALILMDPFKDDEGKNTKQENQQGTVQTVTAQVVAPNAPAPQVNNPPPPNPIIIEAPKHQEPRENKPAPQIAHRDFTGPEVYRHALSGTLYIRVILPPIVSSGSGVLIDPINRLAITNYHVIEDSDEALVYVPIYQGGALVTESKVYTGNPANSVKAKVVATRQRADLAIIQLERLPQTAKPVPMASKHADIGQLVYSIGASGADQNSLWRLTTGTVRNRSRQKASLSSFDVDMMVLETQSPVNHGDSGGPIVNDRAELVGLVSHGSKNDRLISGNVDLEEIKSFLDEYSRRTNTRPC